MATEIEKAEHTLASLQAKRDACVQADERAALAFAAHTGDTKARKRLDEINAAIGTHASELASLDAALKVALERLQQAKAAESRKHAGKWARELLKRADTILQLAQSLDDANTVRVEASRALAEELTQIRGLAGGIGAYAPSNEQFLAMGSRADITAGMQTPFAREVVGEHLPPNQRRTHVSYVAGWRDAIRQGANALLREEQKDAAA